MFGLISIKMSHQNIISMSKISPKNIHRSNKTANRIPNKAVLSKARACSLKHLSKNDVNKN